MGGLPFVDRDQYKGPPSKLAIPYPYKGNEDNQYKTPKFAPPQRPQYVPNGQGGMVVANPENHPLAGQGMFGSMFRSPSNPSPNYVTATPRSPTMPMTPVSYAGARPLSGVPLAPPMIASLPTAGQPPAPPYGYAAHPSPGQPPVPAFGYAFMPASGMPPRPETAYDRSAQMAGTIGMANLQPAIPSGARLAAAGARANPYVAQTPWAGSPAYRSIQLPATSLGPNQSTAPVVDRIANRFDPASWVNRTTTPGEYAQGIERRLVSGPARLQSHMRQDPFSPLAGTAGSFQAMNDAAQAKREASLAQFAATRQKQAEALQARAAAAGVTPEEQQAIENNNSELQAKYQNYRQGALRQGGNVMDFDTFREAMAGGQPTSEIQNALNAQRQGLATERAANRVGKPNFQTSAFLSQRYGIPMAMPADPAAARSFTQNLALNGNPYAQRSLDMQALADQKLAERDMQLQDIAARRASDQDLLKFQATQQQALEQLRHQNTLAANEQQVRLSQEAAIAAQEREANRPRTFDERMAMRARAQANHPDEIWWKTYNQNKGDTEASKIEAKRLADAAWEQAKKEYNIVASDPEAAKYGIPSYTGEKPPSPEGANPQGTPAPKMPTDSTPTELTAPTHDEIFEFQKQFRVLNKREPTPQEVQAYFVDKGYGWPDGYYESLGTPRTTGGDERTEAAYFF